MEWLVNGDLRCLVFFLDECFFFLISLSNKEKLALHIFIGYVEFFCKNWNISLIHHVQTFQFKSISLPALHTASDWTFVPHSIAFD